MIIKEVTNPKTLFEAPLLDFIIVFWKYLCKQGMPERQGGLLVQRKLFSTRR